MKSLAETILDFCQRKLTDKANESIFAKLALTLPNAKRLSMDQALVDLVNRTEENVSVEEILGNLPDLPFSKVWIAGPLGISRKIFEALITPEIRNILSVDEMKFNIVQLSGGARNGFLIETLPNKQIGLIPILEMPSDQKPYFAFDDPCPITISPEGIHFDEEKIYRLISLTAENAERNRKRGLNPKIENVQVFHEDGLFQIDKLYALGEFVARLLVVLNATASPELFVKTSDDLALEKQNASRRRMNRPQDLFERPIKIDVTKASKLAEAKNIKQIRVLLGWTSVRKSKPIISKYGIIYTRKAHDRRIAAEVDRRDVEREVTASRPAMQLDLSGDRPVLHSAAASKKPAAG